MGLFSIIIIALVEALDCFAVAASIGLKKVPRSRIFLLTLSFGIFQGIMTFLGYSCGRFISQYFFSLNKIIPLIILTVIGIKFIHDAFQIKENFENKTLSISEIMVLSIATSVDALTIGISFGFIKINILEAILIISLTAFALGYLGFEIGKKISLLFKSKIPEILAGIILIFLGIKFIF